MSISSELFMAILSMDAYNRGYNAGIDDGILDSNGNLDGLSQPAVLHADGLML